MKPILISGIQPTGKLHIGNYLGALKNFVELQNSGKYECYFFIADYHSITETFAPTEKRKQILDLMAVYIAAGLDPKKSILFVQSEVPEHTELAWVLSALTPFGELKRMTQFKEKFKYAPENINIGLFTYPVLMAADILLYDAAFVPVGEDQLQHLELARALARKFNTKFPARAGEGKTFVELQPLLAKVPRLTSLNDPKKKMAKSRPDGCLFLDDSPEIIRKKIKTAVTDSGKEIFFDEKKKPAVSNLITIYSEFGNLPVKKIEKQYAGKGYAEFKSDLAEIIVKALEPFGEKKKKLAKNISSLEKIFREGGERARATASKKLEEVKKKIGISRKN